jgi:hypothetical protein
MLAEIGGVLHMKRFALEGGPGSFVAAGKCINFKLYIFISIAKYQLLDHCYSTFVS